MRNSIANFVKNLQISKDFAGNRVNGLGNVLRCGGEQTKRTVPLVTFGYLYSPLAWGVGKFWEILNNNGGWGFTCGCGFTFLCFWGFTCEKKVYFWRKRCVFGEKGVFL